MKTIFQNLFSLFSRKHRFDVVDKLNSINIILTKANRLNGKEDFTLSSGDVLINNDKVIVVNWHIYCNRNQIEEIMAGIPKYGCCILAEQTNGFDVYGNEINYFREEYRFTIESDKTNVFIFTFETSEMV